MFNVNLGAVVRLEDVGKAPGHAGMPAVNAAAVPASVAMVAGERPLVWHMSAPLRFCWCRLWRCLEGSGAAGCGSLCLLATDTRKQRSSAS